MPCKNRAFSVNFGVHIMKITKQMMNFKPTLKLILS